MLASSGPPNRNLYGDIPIYNLMRKISLIHVNGCKVHLSQGEAQRIAHFEVWSELLTYDNKLYKA